MTRFDSAKEIYKGLGVDVEKALETLKNVPVSVHCWQGDDVIGFDSKESLSGGIQTTGNYPGRARNPEELLADYEKAFSLMPGKKKINVHASYAIIDDGADRDCIEPKHFEVWLDFANETGVPCVINFWIPDGYKDMPADRMGPRARFKKSLDEILAEPYDKTKVFVTLESKVFGIGLEAYTVGSAEFCLSYSDYKGITPLMDNGHYHPTELVSDKISSLLLFNEKIALHITRPMRWDSDHVVLFDDETKEIAKEIVRNDALDRVFIATDYFDASINRISAWVTGVRNVQKALLFALLQPNSELKKLQDESLFTELMVRQEDLKVAPFGDVWDEYLKREGVTNNYLAEVQAYEKNVLNNR